jgi:hypothetical protein
MIQADTENRIIGSTDPANDRPSPGLMPTNTLDHEKVINKGGEGPGTVRHILLDVRRGRIAYAVLSFDGFLGMATSCSRFRGQHCSWTSTTNVSFSLSTREC